MVSDETDESERRYQQLIRASPAPINLFDASGEILWGNDAVVDLLGLDSRAQLVGRSIFEFIHADDRYVAEGELTEVVENEITTGPTPMKLYRDDGEIRRIRVSTAPGRYRGKRIGQAVIIDVTPLNEIKTALESEQEFIESSLNALQDVFYVVDPSGELERWNETLLDVSGYTESEVRGMNVEEFFVERDAERVSESIATAFLEGSDIVEATALTKYGHEIPFEFRKRRIAIDGEIVGVVGIGRDISVRNAREQHLRTVDHILRHNLRNQLNIIHGTTTLLRDSETGDSVDIERIETSVERLISIFDNHSKIVRFLTNRETTTAVDVVPLFETLVETLNERYPSAEVASDLPDTAMVSMVPTLEEAFFELGKNAIEHNDRSKPSVEIAIDSDNSTVSVSVIDDGPTIPEIEYGTLVGESRVRSTFHPTGLGLWFVHLAVNDSGGTLQFDRRDPRGNVVTIELRTPNAR